MGAKRKPPESHCRKYELAITDYVLGEVMDITPAQLLRHLKTCVACRADLADWQDTYAVLRTAAYRRKPEAKRKLQELLEKVQDLPDARTEKLKEPPDARPECREGEEGGLSR